MFLDCGRKLEYPVRTHARGEHAKAMQKDPQPGVEPRTFLLQCNSATNCATLHPYATVQPSHTLIALNKIQCDPLPAEVAYLANKVHLCVILSRYKSSLATEVC
ncbi:hypothetical protein ATANTOWER_008154 [Ataeniobius toweri]|uniref:Uncharacterized protein n=1 Tax=Ataeniobius toweri TaxID=208326 RepID=A0ABU7CIJ2_9TELE|nr:hypothetical protein [Ataeniobius toweri]